MDARTPITVAEPVDGQAIRESRPWALWIAVICWCALVATGLGWLWRYKATPGGASDAPERWPDASSVPRAPDRGIVVMVAHPQCPCTTASVDELAVLMARVSEIATAHVLFVRPQVRPEGWDDTDLWRRAARIPGVTVSWDEGGDEARAFGALTSGHTAVYDAAGALLFRGGITSARGHAGDNAGRSRIVALLSGERADRRESFVYGCALDEPFQER